MLFRSPTLTQDGPDPRHLDDTRVTTQRMRDGGTATTTDNWRQPNQTRKPTPEKGWTGTTVFNEKTHYPQILFDDITDQARPPRQLPTPHEPTEQERQLRDLTHMPYRAWCPTCVACKGKADYHKQIFDKRPVVQIDYCFMVRKMADGTTTQIPVLTA